MKRSVDNQDGMSLVELLAAITISMVIIGIIYTVFIAGIRVYERIGIENELRSEADYAAARLMNALYAFSPDGLEAGQNQENKPLHQLAFVKNEQFETNSQVGLVSRGQATKPSVRTISIENGKLIVDGEPITSTRLLLDGSSSSFSFRCARREGIICRSGVLTMTLTIQDAENHGVISIKPFTLKTEFGF
ncbi:prepilin-type N-terminal cleavage/methylation domain-containing protein [Geobacillus sp.]|uniref:PilW family protein n=1 Tax=Geobacillus sp. TaxID=1891658 RepID=UPI002580AD0C|nr:prepilin-type N-terminal cleavage/methylation domain-containing protein [Geobacillus sp.]MBR2516640.1 prepilin-type N-terminal cleavage/methylation domain-containing protein [Geobacillus sp.]